MKKVVSLLVLHAAIAVHGQQGGLDSSSHVEECKGDDQEVAMVQGSQLLQARQSKNRPNADIPMQTMTLLDLYPSLEGASSNGTNLHRGILLEQDVSEKSSKDEQDEKIPHFHLHHIDYQSSLAERECGILWFYHIPKCAGTAVGSWLKDLADRRQLDKVIPLMSMKSKNMVKFNSFQAQHIDPLLADARGKLVAIHHHHRGPGLYGLNATFAHMKTRLEAQGCKLIRATFLRDPKAREVSRLFYKTKDSKYLDFEQKEDIFSSMLSSARLVEDDNGEIRYILNNKMDEVKKEPYPLEVGAVDAQAVQVAQSIVQSFEFVGLTEDLKTGIDRLSSMLGLRYSLGPRRVNTVKHKSLKDLDAKLRALVQQRTEQDSILYNFFKLQYGVSDASAP